MVDIAYVAPDNLPYRFKREAVRTVEDMKFDLHESTPDGFEGMWIEVNYDACEPRLRDRCVRLALPRAN